MDINYKILSIILALKARQSVSVTPTIVPCV